MDIAVLSRAKELLSSDDIEMVRLGAVLLEKCKKKSAWKEILSECSTTECTDPFLDGKMAKWKWKIVNNHIIIEEFPSLPKGLWAQLSSVQGRRVYTGKGGMKMIEEALKNYLNKPIKPKKHEQKKQRRKQAK